jgi:large subunit ribosomal protein L21
MYAIVDIAGQQFKVTKDQKVYVHRLEEQEGASITLEKVLLIDNDGDVKVGLPIVEGASIQAKVLAHVKGDKVLIFKKRKRKSYQKMNGHRQFFTQILIEDIKVVGNTAKAKKATAKSTAIEENTSSEEA